MKNDDLKNLIKKKKNDIDKLKSNHKIMDDDLNIMAKNVENLESELCTKIQSIDQVDDKVLIFNLCVIYLDF
jgi:hypothetical protein